ncbi:hypothetical protein [Nocardia sp. NPDC051463]
MDYGPESSAYRFRYDGPVLLAHISDQHAARTWPENLGAAVVLPA